MSNYNPDYEKEISKDLLFFETLSEHNCIGWSSVTEDIKIERIPISECRSELENENQKKLPIQSITTMMPEIEVDMSKIDETHPMYDFFVAHQAKLNSQLLQEFLDEFYSSIFDNGLLYKKFRNFVNNHQGRIIKSTYRKSV